MNLHVIAYPELAQADYELIQLFRKDYNSLFKVMEPHCTIVFSVFDTSPRDFIEEVKKQIDGMPVIHFCMRCAVINKDSFSNNYDAFLVPDEGFSQIVKLHDKLYRDKLSHHHRLDISYLPHISLANSPDVQLIKKIVDQWNEKEFVISGKITVVDVINYENRMAVTIEKIKLGIGVMPL